MKIIYTILLILLTHSALSNENNHLTTNPIQWTMTDVNGTEHNFPQSESNKTTLVLFWATWCPYCKRLMPHLQSIIYQYAELLNLQVFALSINEDGNPKEYLDENGYDFLLFEDADEIAKKYQIRGTPGLLIFNKKGHLVFDLRSVSTPDKKNMVDNPHWQKAIKLAPFWSSEIRKALGQLVD